MGDGWTDLLLRRGYATLRPQVHGRVALMNHENHRPICRFRWLICSSTNARPVCVDRWESVGPDRGMFRECFGGLVNPNCPMLNKVASEAVLPQRKRLLRGEPSGAGEDRNIFAALRTFFAARLQTSPLPFIKSILMTQCIRCAYGSWAQPTTMPPNSEREPTSGRVVWLNGRSRKRDCIYTLRSGKLLSAQSAKNSWGILLMRDT